MRKIENFKAIVIMSFQEFDFEVVHQHQNVAGKRSVGNLSNYFQSTWTGNPIPGITAEFHEDITRIIKLVFATESDTSINMDYGLMTAEIITAPVVNHREWLYPLSVYNFQRYIPHAHDMYLYMNRFTDKMPKILTSMDVYKRGYLTIDISVPKLKLSIRFALKLLVLSLPNTKSVICSALKWHAGTITIQHGTFISFQYIRWSMNFHRVHGDLALQNLDYKKSMPYRK